jgi:hypothetical protein
MFFIFGWGHQKIKSYGPTVKRLCNNCNNEVFWELVNYGKWFTLFFIPIIPYKESRYLICPICNHGILLPYTQYIEVRPLADANKLLTEGKVTEERYYELVKKWQSNRK